MRAVLTVLGVVFALGYPVAVYVGLTQWGTRQVALLLSALVLVGIPLRLSAQGRAHFMSVIKVPLSVVLVMAIAYVLDDHRVLLVTPVAINLVLLWGFAGSLRGPTPIVERFARMQVSDLSDAELRYCRRVTQVWSIFFVLNGTTTALLAWLAPLSVWALYTGLVAYVLMGLLGASEYVIRKARFGRFGNHPIDRALEALLRRGRTT